MLMKNLLCTLLFISLSLTLNAQGKEKTISDKKCAAVEGLNYTKKDDLLITEVEFSDWLRRGYSESFSNTTVTLSIVFDKIKGACCSKLVIADASEMSDKQANYLISVLIKYPWLKKVKFGEKEKVKYLNISISNDEGGKTKAVFLQDPAKK